MKARHAQRIVSDLAWLKHVVYFGKLFQERGVGGMVKVRQGKWGVDPGQAGIENDSVIFINSNTAATLMLIKTGS